MAQINNPKLEQLAAAKKKPNQGEEKANPMTYVLHDANEHEVSKHPDWLESRFHFQFAGWFPDNPLKAKFGHLRVLNDDIVKPANGFGKHPHRDMEIFSYIIEGKLSHKDSKGHAETLSRGAVQYMSAGTGVFHSEMNNDPKQYCRFLQTWIQPHENGLPVQYGSKSFTLEERHNNLLHVISGIKSQAKAPIRLAQDVNVYVSEMDKNHEVSYELGKTRKAYVVCIEGILDLNGVTMNLRDAMRIWGPCTLKMKATGDTEVKILPKDMRQHVDNGERPSGHFMMVELPKDADELD